MSRAASATVAAVLFSGSVFAGCSNGTPHAASTAAAEATIPSSLTASTDLAISPERWASQRLAAARVVVARRLAAANSADSAAWLASFADAGMRPAQRELLGRMRAMGAEQLRLIEVTEAIPPVDAPPGTRVDWDVTARGSYRIGGFDETPRPFSLSITLRADPTTPGSATVTAWGPADRPQPWDLEGLVVRRTADALVLGTGPTTRVDAVAQRAVAAGGRVRAVLGTSERAVWLAPATDAEAAALLGRTEVALKGVAAATDGPISAGHPAGADRIVVVPGAWSSLTGEGREVVLTHELTHATVRRTSTREVPTWLSEGFAEFVAYAGVSLPESKLVQPAIASVRSSGLPTDLPTTTQLDPSSGTLSAAYGLALLATRTIAARHGTARLVRFYRAVAGDEPVPTAVLGDPEGVADHMLKEVLDTDRATVVAEWRQRISGLVAG